MEHISSPSPSTHPIIMTHARNNLPTTDHFEVKNIPGSNFPKVKGLKNLLRSEKIAMELTG